MLWVVLAGVLLVGGCAALIGVTAFRAGNGADHAVNDFLNAAQHGDTAGALRFACPSATAQNVPSARSHSIVGVHVIDIDGKITADVTVDIVMMNGQTHRDDVLLERDAGAWLVCGVRRQS